MQKSKCTYGVLSFIQSCICNLFKTEQSCREIRGGCIVIFSSMFNMTSGSTMPPLLRLRVLCGMITEIVRQSVKIENTSSCNESQAVRIWIEEAAGYNPVKMGLGSYVPTLYTVRYIGMGIVAAYSGRSLPYCKSGVKTSVPYTWRMREPR
jgi:hypothetical protein